jgi:tetratricopeptide (TPR) repeat protein
MKQLVAFKEAVKLKSDYKEAWYEMGWCQNDTKDYGGVYCIPYKSKVSMARNIQVYFELGYAFEKINSIDSAISNYNQCLQITTTNAGVYRQLGYIFYNKNDNEIALNYFQKYEEFAKSPITDYLYWFRKGFMQNAMKQYDGARTSLNKSHEV